jgi:sphingomyelin phosphodiesterase acid-like 3
MIHAHALPHERALYRWIAQQPLKTKVASAHADGDHGWGLFLVSYHQANAGPPDKPKLHSEEGSMSRWSQYLFVVILMSIFSMFGCGGASVVPNPAPTPASSSYYQIVTVSDLHFNPLYDSNLFTQLTTNDPSHWAGIFGTSSVITPTSPGTDTNFLLLLLTLKSMQQNIKNSPVVLFTGDLLGHNIQATYCKIYGSLNPSLAATCLTSQASNIQQFIDNTFEFVAAEIRAYAGNVPVIYAPGNIDTYYQNLGPGLTTCTPKPNVNICNLGPDTNFLTDNGPKVYSEFLGSSFDQQAFLNTFESGGYYSVQPLGSNLLVIALNSNSFVDGSPTSGNASTELDWLDSQLQSAQAAGKKVWILMHVPPGANSQYIAQVAAVPSDVDASDVSMMWDSGPQSTFMSKLAKYSGVVTLMLAGHTHMDEYRILPTGDVLEQLPGISPCFGNNPAYKVLTITENTFTPTDYQSYDYNLAVVPPPAQFGPLYQFSLTYDAQGTLANSLQQLYPQFATDQSTVDTYTLLYGPELRV